MPQIITRNAPAKLNLTLEITGKRTDGYHLLDSLVAFTEYGDTIQAAEADTLSLTIDGPFGAALSPPSSDNLVLRAARKLADWAGIEPKGALTLTKRLPVASGIGGGSSDAAATLLALTELWQLQPSDSDLAQLGLALGADVPVCLAGRTARLRGIGEIIDPAPTLPPVPVVLVNPGVGLSTPEVFRARTGGFSAGADPDGILTSSPTDAAALAHAIAPFGNDLTEAAISRLPIIATMLDQLADQADCLTARMSGSGATCFALFATNEAATSAAARISRTNPGWWVVATHLLSAGKHRARCA
jgi:4-diphosphocytidyl-2-C-methyl-D-erythritol kinase